MKLLFPNGEHGPVDLKDGVTRIGSGAGAEVTIVAPGIAPLHCEIDVRADSATLSVSAPANVVVVNGKQIADATVIKAGDLVLFAKVGARVLAPDRAPAPAPVAKRPENEDDGRTRVRMALPRFVLRGVSGSTFGKNYPVVGTMTVGRAADCDISIPGDEISRHHAKLQVMPDGISVEDMGSANGTFIASKRVHQGLLKPGEELRLDTVRFLLVAPGLEAGGAPSKPAAATTVSAPPAEKSSMGLWVTIAIVVVLALGAGAAYYFGAFK
jgi:hypothetical protein